MGQPRQQLHTAHKELMAGTAGALLQDLLSSLNDTEIMIGWSTTLFLLIISEESKS